MFRQTTLTSLIVVVFSLAGCAKRIIVSYPQVEQYNDVEVTLITGQKVEGVVKSISPHQIEILTTDKETRTFPQSTIRTILRKPPVYDDFGKCISEDEIRSTMNHDNTWIYCVGGGILSLGGSFFIGSMVSKTKENSGSLMGGITLGGGALGTYLFTKAGKSKDRDEAIERIREKRRLIHQIPSKKDKKSESIRQTIDQEKLEQEELRKEREKLLQQLQNKQ
jgi:hypothetical protein